MSSPRAWTLTLALGCAVSAAGCVPVLTGNPTHDPNLAMPERFGGPHDGDETPTAANNVALKTWKQFFAPPGLQALIDTALKNNQELNIRLQELIIAQNEVSARRGEYLPKVRGGAGVGVDKPGEFTSRGYTEHATGLTPVVGDFSFGLVGSWEVDIWNKLHMAAASADKRYLASVESRNFLVTQLVGEIARSYFELGAIDQQLAVLENNIKIQTDALEIVRAEKQSARVTELAVQRFLAEVLKNRSRKYELQQERVKAENRINFLVGRYPQHIERDEAAFEAELPATLATGLPTQLLENRPDVRQAALALEAAQLDVGVARAAFYPSLSIDAGLGFSAFNPGHLLAIPESILFNLAGNLVGPIINRAGIEAQYASANARQIQAVYDYERTLLQAFTDVTVQLLSYENIQKGFALRSEQVSVLNQSVEVSTYLFLNARADYVEVLLTRRDSLDASMDLIDARKNLFLTLVNIYQALGGGWKTAG